MNIEHKLKWMTQLSAVFVRSEQIDIKPPVGISYSYQPTVQCPQYNNVTVPRSSIYDVTRVFSHRVRGTCLTSHHTFQQYNYCA